MDLCGFLAYRLGNRSEAGDLTQAGRPAWRGRRALAALAASVSLFLPAAETAAKPGLEIGFGDSLLGASDQSVRDLWLDRTADARAGLVRVNIGWRDVTSGEPGDPTDAGDLAYDFANLDAAIESVTQRGMVPLLTVFRAPPWAESGKSGAAGTRKPGPAKLADFMTAIARRYSGTFDPGGGVLPRVRYFQLWNEPNLSTYLSPQWKGRKLVAATHYRRMLNAGFDAVKSVHRSNTVVAAGTAPYGDDPGGERSRPLRFWREVFCLKGRKRLRGANCPPRPKRAHLDIMAHHPINTSGGPNRSAIHPDDVSSPDMAEIRRVLRKAEKRHRALPGGRRPIWATEFWWESNPPDRVQGWPLNQHARFIAETMYLSWKAGARAAIALQIRDAEYTKESRFDRNTTGAYFFNGEPKPALRAYQFPFVADRKNRRRVKVWGKAPVRGRVVIERRLNRGWRRIDTVKAGSSRIFAGKVRSGKQAKFRARAGGEKSLASNRV